LRTHRRVLKCQKVPLGFGRGPGEKYSLISKDYDYGRVEIIFEEGFIG